MLLTYKDSPYPIGIAVSSWKTDRYSRMFVIFPIVSGSKSFLEVDCYMEEDGEPIVVKPQTTDWRSLTNKHAGFGKNPEGYPIDDETSKELYLVWDEGASIYPELSEKLYEHYSSLINYYAPFARAYLENEHNKVVHLAKEKSWDTSLMADVNIDFPYKK